MSEPNYDSSQKFSENLLVIEKKKKKTLMNELVNLGSIDIRYQQNGSSWNLVWLHKTEI